MVTIISRRKLPPGGFEEWKQRFADAAPLRKAAGCLGVQRFRAVNDPDIVVVMMRWDSADRCREFINQRLGSVADSLDNIFVEEIDVLDS